MIGCAPSPGSDPVNFDDLATLLVNASEHAYLRKDNSAPTIVAGSSTMPIKAQQSCRARGYHLHRISRQIPLHSPASTVLPLLTIIQSPLIKLKNPMLAIFYSHDKQAKKSNFTSEHDLSNQPSNLLESIVLICMYVLLDIARIMTNEISVFNH